MSTSTDPFWCWPKHGQGSSEPEVNITSILSPYGQNGTIPAMCYPGTPLREDILELMTTLATSQLNAIGTHTHGRLEDGTWVSPDGEGGFGDLAIAERGAVWMVASQLGGRFDTIDGYFCGGGTDSNLQGMWMARQWLRGFPDPMDRGIVVLATTIVHYSIMKAVDLTDIGRSKTEDCPACHRPHLLMGDPSGSGMTYVAMNDQGEMDPVDLERVLQLKMQEGFRRFIVVATMGTTVLGSVDPIEEIDTVIQRLHRTTNARAYVHIDASFGGFTVPFLQRKARLGFEHPSVMSITVDADKMGHLPYPAGIFLCRKGLQRLVARKVAYVRGHHDDTLPGSRSAIAPLIAYWLYQKLGVSGQRYYVQACMDIRDELLDQLRQIQDSRIVLGPIPEWTNFLPLEIRLHNGEIPKALCERGGPFEPFQLRSDYVPSDPSDVRSCPRVVYKLCIMPHHTARQMTHFTDVIKNVLKNH